MTRRMDNPRDEDLQHKIATVIQRGRLENETAFDNAGKVMIEVGNIIAALHSGDQK